MNAVQIEPTAERACCFAEHVPHRGATRPLLLMGVPRSGTTFAAALIDKIDNVVCLSEPDEHVQLMEESRDASDFATRLNSSLEQARRRLLVDEPVFDRRKMDGDAVTNYFGAPDAQGRRRPAFMVQPAKRKKLSNGVLVCAKHNALYIAALPELIGAETFRIIALVRDPVEVLRSWRTLALPVSAGKLPAADRFWLDMRRLTADGIPLLTKQIRIYDLICQRFVECERRISVLRYEDLLDDHSRLADAAGLTITAEVRLEWERTVHGNSARGPVEGELHDAVRSLCARGEAEALLRFYPQYA